MRGKMYSINQKLGNYRWRFSLFSCKMQSNFGCPSLKFHNLQHPILVIFCQNGLEKNPHQTQMFFGPMGSLIIWNILAESLYYVKYRLSNITSIIPSNNLFCFVSFQMCFNQFAILAFLILFCFSFKEKKADRKMVFCYHNCSNVLWEKIVLVWGKKLRKKFANSRP